MNYKLFIAWRYLFAKKSHNVINVISAISVIGMAVGTAALILILSVYNGFDSLVKDNLSSIDPDFRVEAASGKYLDPSLITPKLQAFGTVEEVLEDNVFFTYDGRQGIAKAKGVNESYLTNTDLPSHITEGEAKLSWGDVRYALLGSSLAYGNGIHPRFVSPIELYYPRRTDRISLANPAAALQKAKVFAGGIFSISTDTDAQLLLLPMDVAKDLLQADEEVSALELRTSGKKLRASDLQNILGPEYRVLDRVQQHPSLFKMMRYEKLAIFLILIFVMVIIAFNIFGSLSMLIIEKSADIRTLEALGARPSEVRSIFLLEGWMISLLGLVIGLIGGIALTLLQQHFGLIKLPGNYLVDAYPVVLKFADVAVSAVVIATIGLVTAMLASRR